MFFTVINLFGFRFGFGQVQRRVNLLKTKGTIGELKELGQGIEGTQQYVCCKNHTPYRVNKPNDDPDK